MDGSFGAAVAREDARVIFWVIGGAFGIGAVVGYIIMRCLT
jgi:hypothetical protein